MTLTSVHEISIGVLDNFRVHETHVGVNKDHFENFSGCFCVNDKVRKKSYLYLREVLKRLLNITVIF